MDLSIIIVSWNIKDKLKDNLTALLQSQGNIDVEIFVVDNNSQDNTVAMVKQKFPDVKLIANQENLGFAKACNQAIKQASGEFILLLNPDMQVFRNTLDNMLRWMKANKQAWVAGCNLVDEQGKTIKHVRRFPGVCDQLAIVLKLPHFLPGLSSKYLSKYLSTYFDYGKAQVVDSIRGGFMMIRTSPLPSSSKEERENITQPLLDEQYFLWFEEVDFCKQIQKQGGQVWYTPVAKCIDFVGQSFKQLPRSKAQKYFRDSQLKYFKKWQPAWQYWLLKLAWPIGLLITWLGQKMKIKSKAQT